MITLCMRINEYDYVEGASVFSRDFATRTSINWRRLGLGLQCVTSLRTVASAAGFHALMVLRAFILEREADSDTIRAKRNENIFFHPLPIRLGKFNLDMIIMYGSC